MTVLSLHAAWNSHVNHRFSNSGQIVGNKTTAPFKKRIQTPPPHCCKIWLQILQIAVSSSLLDRFQKFSVFLKAEISNFLEFRFSTLLRWILWDNQSESEHNRVLECDLLPNLAPIVNVMEALGVDTTPEWCSETSRSIVVHSYALCTGLGPNPDNRYLSCALLY